MFLCTCTCTYTHTHTQGRPCPKCGRPNHHHSIECYKCGEKLPPSATKWIYVGSHSGRGTTCTLAGPCSFVRCTHTHTQCTHTTHHMHIHTYTHACTHPHTHTHAPPPHTHTAYRSSHDTAAHRLAPELETRAPISCIRCHKLRSHRRMKCGRCGDVFETKAVVNPEGEEGEEGSPTVKKKKNSLESSNQNPGTYKWAKEVKTYNIMCTCEHYIE